MTSYRDGNRHMRSLAVTLTALVLLVGCDHGQLPGSSPPGCTTPSGCGGGQAPAQRPVCETNAECGDGFTCTNDVCVAQPPTAGQYRACALDVDCPVGDHCDLGACAHACVADRDCTGGDSCDLRGRCASTASANQPPPPSPPGSAAPVLAVDESELHFADFSQTKELTIHNTGDAPLDFRILADKVWLSATPLTGTIAAKASARATIAIQKVGTGTRGTVSVVSTGGTASTPVTVPQQLTGLYQGEVRITGPMELGSRALAIGFAQEPTGRLQGVVDDARSPAFGFRAALVPESVVMGSQVSLRFEIPGRIGPSNNAQTNLKRTVTVIGAIAAGGHLTGSYSETIQGVLSVPVVLSGTVDLVPVDRAAPLLPAQAAPIATVGAPTSPSFLSCDVCPSGVCPASHALAGADFLRSAFKFYRSALADGTNDAYAPIRTCVDKPGDCYNPIALHCAQAHFYKAIQAGDATTCPETGSAACAPRGLLDSFKGLLTWSSLQGNERLVRAYALERALDDQGNEIATARAAFAHGFLGDDSGGARVYGMFEPVFLNWLAGLPPSIWANTQLSFFPEQMSGVGKTQSTIVGAFGDFDRLATDLALWVAAARDQLVGQHRLYADAPKDLLLEAARDVADTHVALALASALLTRMGGSADRLSRVVNGTTALTQTAARISAGFNPAGYPDGYIGYTYVPALGASSNNYLELVKDFSNKWLAKATAAFDKAQGTQREFESTYQNLAKEVVALNSEYGQRIADLCGGSARMPSLDGCGTSSGQVFDTGQQIKSAYERLQSATTAVANQYRSIEIEQNRAAQQVNLHRVTAYAITQDGQKLEALAEREATLEQLQSASGGFFGAISSLGSLPPNIAGAVAAVGSGVVGANLAASKGEIEQERVRIDTLARARVEYDQAKSQLIDSAAHVKLMMLEIPTLRINALVAAQDVARLLGLLRSQFQEATDTKATLTRQQGLSGDDPRRDPAFRQYRNATTMFASKAFDDALAQLFLVTRALEYETGMTFARRGDLFALTTPTEMTAYLTEIELAYQDFTTTVGTKQQRENKISLRDQIFRFEDPLSDNATGVTYQPADVFHRLLADPRNRDEHGNVRLGFSLSLAAEAQLFNHDLCMDTITGIRISLVGSALGVTQPEVLVRQTGSAYLRSCTDRGDGGDYVVSEYSLENTLGLRQAIVQAGLNLSSPNDTSSGALVNTELYGRPIAAPYELTIDRTFPANAGLDLTKLDDIVLFIQHESRTVR